MELFKHVFALSFIVFPIVSEAQIVGQEGKEIPSKDNTESLKKATPKRVPTTGADEFTFYLGAGAVFSDRTLRANDYPFGKSIGERANEKPASFASYRIGIRNRVNNWLSYDIGLGYTSAGEKYSYASSVNDSTFSYKTSYSYFTLPMQVLATYGKDYRFFLGGGIQPQFLVSYQQKQNYTSANNTAGNSKIERLDHANTFQLAAIVSAGVQIKLSKYLSFYCQPQYVWNITPTTDKQSTYVHKLHYLNLQFGLAFHLHEAK